MLIETGYPYYGQQIGVLVFSTSTPRIPGDAGHAASFSYPVRYEVIKGGFADLLDYNDTIKENILEGCRHLKNAGIKGILGDCGMMSLYQDCIGAEVGLPFVGSSLCQLPMVWQMIGRSGSIGILTGHSELLSEKHLLASCSLSELLTKKPQKSEIKKDTPGYDGKPRKYWGYGGFIKRKIPCL